MTANMLGLFIQKAGISFVTTQMGKGVMDETHPLFLGNCAQRLAFAGAYGHRIGNAPSLAPLLESCFKQGGVHLIDVPVDYNLFSSVSASLAETPAKGWLVMLLEHGQKQNKIIDSVKYSCILKLCQLP